MRLVVGLVALSLVGAGVAQAGHPKVVQQIVQQAKQNQFKLFSRAGMRELVSLRTPRRDRHDRIIHIGIMSHVDEIPVPGFKMLVRKQILLNNRARLAKAYAEGKQDHLTAGEVVSVAKSAVDVSSRSSIITRLARTQLGRWTIADLKTLKKGIFWDKPAKRQLDALIAGKLAK